MDNLDQIKNDIIKYPENYFETQSNGLEEKLKEVKLSDKERNEIIKDSSKKIIQDKILGLFKIGDIINTILNWNEEIDNNIKEAKKEHLIMAYFERQDEDEKALFMLKNLLTSAQGNTLFNKIIKILDDSPPDFELTDHLGNALKYIADSDFAKLFKDHVFALGQIEKLSPQALTILSDYQHWPVFEINNYASSGHIITTDWTTEFVNAYSKQKFADNSTIVNRIKHSINELYKGGYIKAQLFTQTTAKCCFSDIGQLVVSYIRIKN